MKQGCVTWVFVISILLLLIGTVATLVAVLAGARMASNGNNGEGPVSSPSMDFSIDPTPSVNTPTSAIITSMMPTKHSDSHPSLTLLADLIRVHSPSSDLTDSSSPAYLAYHRMINEDSFWLKANEEDVTDSRLLQRFALATFWYATGGPTTWRVGGGDDDGSWVSGTDECTWEGVHCDDSHTVRNLRCHDNGLSNIIPPEIGLLSGLFELDVELNALKGRLPKEMVQLSRLTALLVGNDYSGIGSNEIVGLFDVVTKLPSLGSFTCYGCGLDGSIPTEIGHVEALRWFDLRRNDLTGLIPSEIGLCYKLEGFTVGDNDGLSGPVPTELFSLPYLVALGLYGTELTGSIPCDVVQAATIDCGKIKCNSCCVQGFDDGISGIQRFSPLECPPY